MRFLISIIIFFLAFNTNAQVWAVTEKGDTIYVYSDGTWSFDKEERSNQDQGSLDYLNTVIKLDTIATLFTVNSKAEKKLSSQYGFFEFQYDSDEWKRVPAAQLNEDAEFALQAKNNDIYVAIISEEIEIGIENIYKIAINNAKENLGVEIDILKSELRNINGIDVIRGVMGFNLNGMNLIFDSFYFSDSRGTVQLTTWTASNLHEKYEDDILSLLNGLVIAKQETK